MNVSSSLYEFAFRGFLAEEGLDRAGRIHRNLVGSLDEEYAQRLGIELLDDQFVSSARQMAMVYMAITAFENSVRKLIKTVLLEQKGEDWWNLSVSEKIRTRAEQKRQDEEKVRWHSPRGADPIYYSLMGDLSSIIRQNWQEFEPYMPSAEWAASILDVIERSRNVIMHSGALDKRDVERVGIYIRDWVKQVGA